MDLPRKIRKVRNYFNELCQEICENSNSGTEKNLKKIKPHFGLRKLVRLTVFMKVQFVV